MQDEKPSYLQEMLTSQSNIYMLLASVSAGVLLSIPYGFGIGSVPLIMFAAGEALAAMYIPNLSTYRDKVDRRNRRRVREQTRSHLIHEIQTRDHRDADAFGSIDAYHRMLARVQSLYTLAENRRSYLSIRDVERLDNATLDYLSMWLAALVINDRSQSVNTVTIEHRVKEIENDIQSSKEGADKRQLQKARNDYIALLSRHRHMLSRMTAIEAAMLSMPDQIEEIYQTIMTAPMSSDLDHRLEESIAKLRLEEEIEAELKGELHSTEPEIVVQTRNQDELRQRAVSIQKGHKNKQ